MHSKTDLVECAWRELTKRREVYPKLLRQGKGNAQFFEKQTDMMYVIYRLISQMSDEAIEAVQVTNTGGDNVESAN